MPSVTTARRPPFRAGMAVEALHHLVVGAVVRHVAEVRHFRVKRAAQPPPGASATASFSPARTVRDAFT